MFINQIFTKLFFVKFYKKTETQTTIHHVIAFWNRPGGKKEKHEPQQENAGKKAWHTIPIRLGFLILVLPLTGSHEQHD